MAGVLLTGKTPNCIAPAGSSEGRDQGPVCDETSQITMGFKPVRLWGAVGGNQARFADRGGLGAGQAQAGCLKIRPGLLRAVLAYRADVEPVSLGEGLGYAGFHLRGEAGQNGEGG